MEDTNSEKRYVSLIGSSLDRQGQSRKFSELKNWGAKMFLASAFASAAVGGYAIYKDADDEKGKLLTDLPSQAIYAVAGLAVYRKLQAYWAGFEEEDKIVDTQPVQPQLTRWMRSGPVPGMPTRTWAEHTATAFCQTMFAASFTGATVVLPNTITPGLAASALQQARLSYMIASGRWQILDKKDIAQSSEASLTL